MLLRYYAVKDVVVGSFMSPVPMANDETAVRSLKLAANDPNAFKENKNDIQLWYLFSMSTETGIVEDNQPYLIGNLVDFVEIRKEN